MQYIVKLSYFLYFFLLIVLVSFLVIFYQSQDTVVHSNLLWLISLLFLPLYDQIYNLFSSDLKSYEPKSLWELILTIGSPLLIITLYVFWVINFFLTLWFFSLYAIVKKIDAKLFFSLAFILFFYIWIYLLVAQWDQVENLSVMAYYILIAWVWVHFIQSMEKKSLA